MQSGRERGRVPDHPGVIAGQLRQRGVEAAGQLGGALVRVEAPAFSAAGHGDPAGHGAEPVEVELVVADGGGVAADEQLDVGRAAGRACPGAGRAAPADADRGSDGVEDGGRALLGVEVQVERAAFVAGQQLAERRLVLLEQARARPLRDARSAADASPLFSRSISSSRLT